MYIQCSTQNIQIVSKVSTKKYAKIFYEIENFTKFCNIFEFLLTGKPELLHFAPYTRDQIVKIIQDRLTVVSYNHLDICLARRIGVLDQFRFLGNCQPVPLP